MLIELNTSVKLVINSPSDLPKLRVLMEQNNLKLNKSKIARELGIDRKTVTKHLNGFQKSTTRNKKSKVEQYHNEIKELLNSDTQVFQFRSVLYRYMIDNSKGFNIAESTFYRYLNSVPEFNHYFRYGKMSNSKALPVIRFETAPGIQAQLDWKESISFVLKDTGEVVTINVLSMVMGYSRLRLFMPSLFKTQDVLLHLMTRMFEIIGGVPHIILTDNMKTIMDESRTLSRPGAVNTRFEEFAKDFGFQTKACVAATPNTKGKVESQMKFLAEIMAYSGKLNLVELFEKVEHINERCNSSISQGTGKIPVIEFEKEKDSLLPLPHESIRNQYRIKTMKVKVNTAGMISVHSKQYSVPYTYIGKVVEYQIHDAKVYVYFNTKLIAVHNLSNEKLNYTPEHYTEILSLKFPGKSSDEVREFAKNNLKLIGGVFSNE